MDKSILTFLSRLRNNNNREWFNDNKEEYLQAKAAFEGFINDLIPHIRSFDPAIDLITAKDCTFRIYRDIRFSKDKNPYKTNMGAYINRGGRRSPFAGYYVHVEPGQSFLAGGIYMPPADVLKKIRQEIVYNYDEFRKIIDNKKFKETFGEMDDPDKLVNPPKGFPTDFPGIEMIKLKSYAVMHHVDDGKVIKDDFIKYSVDVFKTLRPLNNFFNNIFISE
jgi:uncharacterized protein (TIGR02453 family)